MSTKAKPTRLPARTRILVEGPGGKTYPAWIDRRSRRLYALCGEVARAVPVVIVIGRPRTLPVHQRLYEKLVRWGYLRVTLKPTLAEPEE